MADKIIISGMEFYGYHGVLGAEKILGQRFIVDLEMKLDLKEAGISDNMEETVSYASVFEEVEKIVTLDKFDLIEALAEKISTTLLEGFPIKKVKVRVKKPHAPIKGVFEYVAVEIKRDRK